MWDKLISCTGNHGHGETWRFLKGKTTRGASNGIPNPRESGCRGKGIMVKTGSPSSLAFRKGPPKCR